MFRQPTPTLVFGLLAILFLSATPASGPVPAGLREEVETRIVQLEVTAWPRREGLSCRDLRVEDLELRVNGRPRAIAGFDPAGTCVPLSPPIPPAGPDTVAAPAPAAPPLQVVLVFDALSLAKPIPCWTNPECGECTEMLSPWAARGLALEWAENWARAGLRPGDRVVIAVLGTGVRFVSPWLDRPENVLAALARLEKEDDAWPRYLAHGYMSTPSPYAVAAPGAPRSWWRAWRDLFTALEEIPGTKQVVRVAGGRISPAASGLSELSLRELAGRLAAARAVLHVADPFVLVCRECHPRWTASELADATGGELFTQPRATAATLRRIAACRFLLSFPVEPGDESRRSARSIRLTDRSGRFRFRHPGTWERRVDAPSRRERAEATLLLPETGAGLAARARLVPLRPDATGRRWRGVLLARIHGTGGSSPRADRPGPLVVDLAMLQGSRVLASHAEELSAEEARALVEGRAGRTWALPVSLRPGRWYDIAVLVHPPGSWQDGILAAFDRSGTLGDTVPRPVGTWFRTATAIPPLPRPGDPGPFLLVDRPGRAAGKLVPVPSLADEVPPGTLPVFLAHACAKRARGTPRPLAAAHLVALDRNPGPALASPPDPGRSRIPVAFEWRPDGDRPRCGWWVGRPNRPPPPGEWILRVSVGSDAPAAVLQFRVTHPVGDPSPSARPVSRQTRPGSGG